MRMENVGGRFPSPNGSSSSRCSSKWCLTNDRVSSDSASSLWLSRLTSGSTDRVNFSRNSSMRSTVSAKPTASACPPKRRNNSPSGRRVSNKSLPETLLPDPTTRPGVVDGTSTMVGTEYLSTQLLARRPAIFVCEYIRFHVSESSLRIMLDAVVEGLQNVLFEMGCARVRLYDRDAVGVSEAAVVDSEYIHFDACRHGGNYRAHVLRDARSCVKCAIAVHTRSISCSEMLWRRKKSRAPFAPLTFAPI